MTFWNRFKKFICDRRKYMELSQSKEVRIELEADGVTSKPFDGVITRYTKAMTKIAKRVTRKKRTETTANEKKALAFYADTVMKLEALNS